MRDGYWLVMIRGGEELRGMVRAEEWGGMMKDFEG